MSALCPEAGARRQYVSFQQQPRGTLSRDASNAVPGQEHTLHLLIIGAERDSAERLISALRNAGTTLRAARASSLHEFAELLAQSWDLVLCQMPENEWPRVFQLCDAQELPLVLISEKVPAPRPSCLRAQFDALTTQLEPLCATLLREGENARLKRRVAQLEQNLAALTRRHDLLLEQSPGAYSYLQDGMHLYCNRSYARLFGYDDVDAVRTTPLLDLVQVSERAALRAVFNGETCGDTLFLQGRKRDGSAIPLMFRFTPVDYQGKACMLLAVSAAEEERLLNAEQPEHATRDLVTGLETAKSFERLLTTAIHAAAQSGTSKTLVLLTLSDHDALATVLGRSGQRQLLREIAQQLLRHSAQVARLQDHEFALLHEEDDPVRALHFCRELQRELAIAVSEAVPSALEIGCEVGMALIDERATTVAELLTRARHQGQEHSSARDSTLDAKALAHLQRALERQEVQLLFQPLVPLRAATALGVELLPCFTDAEADIAYDAHTLRRAATLGGLTEALDRQLTTQALRLAARNGDNDYWLALSATTLQSPRFLPWLGQEVADVPGELRLNLELNEVDLLGARDKALSCCRGLTQLGLGYSIACFGGGLAPASWLQELSEQGLRPQLVKLDPALLRDLAEDEERIARLRTLIAAAHAVEVPVVAPDVADLNLLPLLWQLGVDHVQGSALEAPASPRSALPPTAETNITAGKAAAQESTWH